MNTQTQIKVWDIFVRFFHWTLVAAFFTAFATEDEVLSLHVLAGYYISAILSMRIVWGLIGTKYARFSNFVYSPQHIKQYLSDELRLKAKRYIGHNPAGGAMVLLLLLSLIITVITGLVTYGIEEQAGPLAESVSHLHGDWAEELHEVFANLTMFLVVIHIIGVVVSSLLHSENLIKAMWTGKKRGLDDA